MMRVILVLFLFVTGMPFCKSQDADAAVKHKIGFMIGYGNQALLSKLNYDYRLTFFQFQYYYLLWDKEGFDLEILVQPQYNLTRFRNPNDSPNLTSGYEYGLNAGVLFRKYLRKDGLSIYGLISAGPHYVSGVPTRQIPGFIFSDNFMAGVQFRIKENIYFDFRTGFRHISNAEIRFPNGGVNNMILNGGIVWNINKKK